MSATTRNHVRKTHSAARAAALVLAAGAAVAACGTSGHGAANHPTPLLPTKPATHAHVVATQTKPVSVASTKPASSSKTASQASTGAQATSSTSQGCSDSQVSETFGSFGAGMGSRFMALQVRNVSSTNCWVAGPVSFIMTGVNGKYLTNGVNWPAIHPTPGIDLVPGASAYMSFTYVPVNLGPGTPETGCAMLASVQAGMSNTQGVGGGVVVPLPGGPVQVCGAVSISFLRTTLYPSTAS